MAVKRRARGGAKKGHGREERGGLLKVIAVFKIFKALLLLAAGLGALRLLNPATAEPVRHWIRALAWRFDSPSLSDMGEEVLHLRASRLEIVGISAILYAALFTVEGVGLWLARRWAEYLTIVATSSFVPFEIYELTRRVSWARVVTLAINLLVVGYLAWKVRRKA